MTVHLKLWLYNYIRDTSRGPLISSLLFKWFHNLNVCYSDSLYLDRNFLDEVEWCGIDCCDGIRINIISDHNLSQHGSLLTNYLGQLSCVDTLNSRNSLLSQPESMDRLVNGNFFAVIWNGHFLAGKINSWKLWSYKHLHAKWNVKTLIRRGSNFCNGSHAYSSMV